MTALLSLSLGLLWGSLSFRKSRKSNSKLLFYFSLIIIDCSLLFTGLVSDFLTIILTGNNMDNTFGLHGILSFVWFAPGFLLAMYLGIELLMPDFPLQRKKILLFVYSALGILYELVLLLDTMNSLEFSYPNTPGEDMIDSIFVLGSPAFIIVVIFMVTILIFYGFGFLYKSIQTSGILRKKFLILSIGYNFFIIFGAFELFTFLPDIPLIIVRYGVISSGFLFFLGIKEERVKAKKETLKRKGLPDKSKVTLAETLSYSRPAQITKEEVTYFKEQKICLVCKGKVEKFNVFLCSKCDTIYCENCARALSNLENSCWVCAEPIDDTKPVKPIKKDIEQIDIEISNKDEHAPKTDEAKPQEK